MNSFFPLAQGPLDLKVILILRLVFAGPLIFMLAPDQLGTPRDQEAPLISATGALPGTH